VGVDNPVSLAISGFDPTTVSASISGAGNTITKNPSGPGYIVRVTAPSNSIAVTLSVRSGATTRTAGSFNFRSKRIPEPIVLANGVDEHATVVDKNVLANAGGLVPRMRDFDFDLPGLRVVSFTLSTTVSGDIQEKKSTTNRFTPEMVSIIQNARRGQRIFFEDIVVQMPTGPQTVRSFALTVR
jgi:hypothetical protein